MPQKKVTVLPALRIASAAQVLAIGGWAHGEKAMEVFQALANATRAQ